MSVELTTSPAAAFSPGAHHVGRCERQENGDVWLYVGVDDYFVFPAGDAAEGAERAWNATFTTHLWLVER
jgi:hypothetical protein